MNVGCGWLVQKAVTKGNKKPQTGRRQAAKNKCSTKIFPPIKTKTKPPNSSAGILKRQPQRLPSASPSHVTIKVTPPIIKEDRRGSKFRKAKVKPTASASMLVASARVRTTVIFLGSMLEAASGF